MKNILISLLVFTSGLFLFASSVHATTYYIDTQTGQNGNSGITSNSPLQSLDYTMQLLSAGDTVELVAPSTNPSRGILESYVSGTSDNRITIEGPSSGNRAYVTAGENLSDGDTIGELITNGDLEGWIDDSTIWDITSISGIGTGSVTKETTTVRDQASAKIIRNGTSIYLRWDVKNLPANTEYTFSYYHQESAAFIRPRYYIKEDLATDNYLQLDDSWSTTAYSFDPNDNSVGTWAQTTKTFTTNGAGDYFFTVVFQNDATFYLDDVSLVPTTNTFQWSVYSGDIYSIDGYVEDPRTFAKASTSDWSTNGMTSLSYVPQAASLAGMAAGEWWYESGTLYYYLDSGETIGDLHIEAGTGTGVHGITMSHDYYTWNNIDQYMGNQYGMYLTGNNAIINDSSFCINGSMGLNSAGVNNVANRTSSAYTFVEDTFEVSGGDFTCNWCLAEYSFDDGFQAVSSGNMTINYSISRSNGLENQADNTGFAVESASAKMYLYNSLSYGNYGWGIMVGANSGYEVINNITWNSTSAVEAWMDASYEANGTHTNNIIEAKHANWTLDPTEQLNVNPQFTDAASGNYYPLSTSPAIDAGTDVGLTIDYVGRSVPQNSIPDIGPYEYIYPVSSTQALTTSAPSFCTNESPSTAPWIYSTTPKSTTSILLSFAKAGSPFDHYALEYGTEPGVYKYSSTNIGGVGTTTYLVDYLQPNTTYYFRIRGGNNCATGEWSSETSATTFGGSSTVNQSSSKKTDQSSSSKENTETPKEDNTKTVEETPKILGYSISILVKDTNNNPVEGAKVTIHSDVQETITDKNGVATFSNVEPGEHKVLVAYDGYEGEQNINLTGNSKEFSLNITVEKKNNFASPQALVLIGGLMFIVAILIIPFLKLRKRA